MSMLEVLIYILSVIMLWILFTKRAIKKQNIVYLLSFTILLLTLHILFDITRWQLYTLYLAVFTLGILVYLKTIMNIILKNFIRISTLIVLILLIIISGISAFAFPIYEIPSPNGDYLIGTESFIIEDELRYELYSDDSNELRKIKIQIWYPAETKDGYEQAAWLEDGLEVSRALSKDTGLPGFVLDHTVEIM